MPTLSMFYGVIIRMFAEKGGQHHEPHIHAVYGDKQVVISLDGEIIEGSLPANKMSLLKAWIDIHQDELKANWQLLLEGDVHFKIDPLK